MTHKIPFHSVDISALTDDDPSEPGSAVQYAIVYLSGRREINGDQQWVADGRGLRWHNGSGLDVRVERRTVTITYGEWEATP